MTTETLLLIGGGTFLGYAGHIFGPVIDFCSRKLWYKVDFMSQGDGAEEFKKVDLWLNSLPGMKKAKHVFVKTSMTSSEPTYLSGRREDHITEDTTSVVPGFGLNVLRWNKKIIWVWRWKSENGMASVPIETLTFHIVNGKRTDLDQILSEADTLWKNSRGYHNKVYKLKVAFDDVFWNRVNPKLRSLESVILPEGVMEGILKDIENFLQKESTYDSLGVPYRRGYMFSGVPGSGKTSTIAALANALRLPLYVVPLSDANMSDAELAAGLEKVPKHAMIVFEDIDCVAIDRDPEKNSKLTFGGFLNILDGLMSCSGHITFITTNHPEKLDSALVRRGRIDVKVDFAHASKYQIEKLYTRFFPNALAEEVETFTAKYSEVNMADVQGDILEKLDKENGMLGT